MVVLAIFAAGVAGFVALQVLKPKPATRTPVKQLQLVRVAPIELRQGALTVTGNGLVKPRAEVALAAEVSGRVMFVSPSLVTGGTFAKGDSLVRLDPEPFRALLAWAEADRRAAEANLALAEQLLKRTGELIAQGFQSQQALDERVANRDQARAAHARAEALERQRRNDLERTEILAPFHGQVLSERVNPGETVQPGKELARIFGDESLEIAVSLTDRDLALIADPWKNKPAAGAAGSAAASVAVEHGGRMYRWPAKVDRVEAAVDSATRTFNVVVRVNEPSARGKQDSGGAAGAPPLLVGMYATVEIEGRDAGRYAVVPRRALRDGSVLWLLDAGGTVRIQPVRLLREARDTATVAADELAIGARVIVSDLKVVTSGMPVRVLDSARVAPEAPARSAP